MSIVLRMSTLWGTVADNIRYGRLDATDEEVEAAKLAMPIISLNICQMVMIPILRLMLRTCPR